MATSLLLLLFNLPTPWIALPVIAIILREISVSALREWLAGRNLRHLVKVSNVGKAKTATQMVSLTLLLLVLPLPVRIPSHTTLSFSSWFQNLVSFGQGTKFEVPDLGITQDIGQVLFIVGIGLFYVSTLLSVLSGGLYVKSAWPILTRGEQ